MNYDQREEKLMQEVTKDIIDAWNATIADHQEELAVLAQMKDAGIALSSDTDATTRDLATHLFDDMLALRRNQIEDSLWRLQEAVKKYS